MYIKAPTAKGNYRYVREYPAACRKETGKTYFVRTLGTRNIAEANKRQKEIDDLYDAEVNNILSRALIPKEERRALVDYLIQCDLLPANATDIDLATVNALLEKMQDIREAAANNKSVVAEFGIIPEFNLFEASNRLLDAKKKFSKRTHIPTAIDVIKVPYSRSPSQEPYTMEMVLEEIEKRYALPLTTNDKPSTHKLQHVYEAWENAKKRTPRQKQHVARAYKLLKDWFGNRPINAYSKQDMRDLLAAFQRMPKTLPPDIRALPSFKKQ